MTDNKSKETSKSSTESGSAQTRRGVQMKTTATISTLTAGVGVIKVWSQKFPKVEAVAER